jgi:hypothetical protein
LIDSFFHAGVTDGQNGYNREDFRCAFRQPYQFLQAMPENKTASEDGETLFGADPVCSIEGKD